MTKMELSAFGECTSLQKICIETDTSDIFVSTNGYSGSCGGNVTLTVLPETTDKEVTYIFRMWAKSNFGPLEDESQVIRAVCELK